MASLVRPADLAALDRYLDTLRDLQHSGLRINIHLGEPSGAGFSRQVLSRIPGRIGHGILLLDDTATVELIREHGTCPGMCPVSSTRPGVWDWTRSSPAAEAMRLSLPVTISTDYLREVQRVYVPAAQSLVLAKVSHTAWEISGDLTPGGIIAGFSSHAERFSPPSKPSPRSWPMTASTRSSKAPISTGPSYQAAEARPGRHRPPRAPDCQVAAAAP